MFNILKKPPGGERIKHNLTAILIGFAITLGGWIVLETPVYADSYRNHYVTCSDYNGGNGKLYISKSLISKPKFIYLSGSTADKKATLCADAASFWGYNPGKTSTMYSDSYAVRFAWKHTSSGDFMCYVLASSDYYYDSGDGYWVIPYSNHVIQVTTTGGGTTSCTNYDVQANPGAGITGYAVEDAHVHDYHVSQYVSCTANGIMHCDCGSEYVYEYAWGHNSNGYTPPTCTSPGRYYCTNCNSTMQDISALGHAWGNWYDYGDATYHRRQCSRCGGYDYASHSRGSGNGSVIQNQDCTHAEIRYNKCTVCGNQYGSTQTKAALNHAWTDARGNASYLYSAATCTANAKYYQKCSRCGTKGGSIQEQTGTQYDHPLDNGTVKKEANVYENGILLKKCKECSYTIEVPIPHKVWNIFVGENRVQEIYVGTTKIYDMYAGNTSLVVNHDQ